jgi:catechol 2,3-dioxygenase-like lactoylglutathione lyase family enzyme
MEQRISLVTLGVQDLARARAFKYEALGWRGAQQPDDEVFADPDGYVWEVAHNPDWTQSDEGSARLPTPNLA